MVNNALEDKVPNSNGINVDVFQTYWDIAKSSIYEAMRHSFVFGRLPNMVECIIFSDDS